MESPRSIKGHALLQADNASVPSANRKPDPNVLSPNGAAHRLRVLAVFVDPAVATLILARS